MWSPQGPPPPPEARYASARAELTAFHPTYLRLLVDWAKLQPDPARAPSLEGVVSGCARTIAPCAPYAGVGEELAAIASQQRRSGAGSFQVVVDLFGTPAWAARPASGCERAGLGAFSRVLTPAGLAGYRALVRSLLALAAREGVALTWWSPWNEPNGPKFMSPQRGACDARSPSLAPGAYAELVRALAQELRAAGGGHHIVLGELAAYESDTPGRTSISEFVAGLPPDVLCAGSVWSVHAYAIHARPAPPLDPVRALEHALDARGGCAAGAPVWVSEAGAGAPHPGRPRSGEAAQERSGCEALAEQLLRWRGDARVTAILQFSFREDPDFPVGLLTPDLARAYPAYGLWLTWSRALSEGRPPPTAAACA